MNACNLNIHNNKPVMNFPIKDSRRKDVNILDGGIEMSHQEHSNNIICDRSGRLIYVSSEFAEVVGFSAEALIGRRPPHPWWPPDNRDHLSKIFEVAVGDDGWRFEGLEMTLPLITQKSTVPVICSIKKMPNGDTEFLFRPSDPESSENSIAQVIEYVTERLTPDDIPLDDIPLTAKSSGAERVASLSIRERSVLELLLAGKRVADVAELLHISIHTARNHRKSIFAKLSVGSQVELMADLGVCRDLLGADRGSRLNCTRRCLPNRFQAEGGWSASR